MECHLPASFVLSSLRSIVALSRMLASVSGESSSAWRCEGKACRKVGGAAGWVQPTLCGAELSDLVLCLLGQCTNRVYHARYD